MKAFGRYKLNSSLIKIFRFSGLIGDENQLFFPATYKRFLSGWPPLPLPLPLSFPIVFPTGYSVLDGGTTQSYTNRTIDIYGGNKQGPMASNNCNKIDAEILYFT